MIPFARSQEGKLISVYEVPGGLACNCICPACSSPLIARKGKRNAHHFAHYRKPECIHALESSLHHLAKAVLKRRKEIVLPPVYIHGSDDPPIYARHFQFAKVYLENQLGSIRPDLILESASSRVLVEIAVHHTSTPAKIWKLQQSKLAAIEIDIKSIYLELAGLGKGADLEAFTQAIIQNTQHKKWLFNPKQHALEYGIRSQADRKKIKHKRFGQRSHYTVEGCPLGKRYRRYGPMEGRSYANVFTDCQSCQLCFEIEYHKKHVGYRQIATHPKYVYCSDKKI